MSSDKACKGEKSEIQNTLDGSESRSNRADKISELKDNGTEIVKLKEKKYNVKNRRV